MQNHAYIIKLVISPCSICQTIMAPLALHDMEINCNGRGGNACSLRQAIFESIINVYSVCAHFGY